MHRARDTVIRPDDNPYLVEAAAIGFGEPDPVVIQSLAAAGDRAGLGRYIEQLQRARDTLAVRYAHAIPGEAALDTLADLAPLVELGAGTGYWAWLLRRRGVDILAFDACPPIDTGHANPYHRNADAVGVCWTTVQPGGPEQAAAFPERALFLCWPPDTDMAEQALQHYAGPRLALIGTSGSSMETATPAFYAALRETFALQAIVPIPQWYGLDDRLTIWVRWETPIRRRA